MPLDDLVSPIGKNCPSFWLFPESNAILFTSNKFPLLILFSSFLEYINFGVILSLSNKLFNILFSSKVSSLLSLVCLYIFQLKYSRYNNLFESEE